MTPRRVLVLTSSTGAGHDTHAQAFAEWAGHLYGSAVEVRIEHMLEDSSWFLRQGVHLYNAIQRTAPWTHHLYYQLVEVLSLIHSDSVAFGGAHYRRVLEAFRPDVILSVHDCLNRGYFPVAKRVLGPATRCVTLCFEFDGGYGCSRNWAEASADLFQGKTEATVDFGVRHGIPRERCRVFGNLLRRRFSRPRFTEAERAEYLRQRFGFAPERLTLLLATGGAGAENHVALLEKLRPLAVQVIALAGRNPTAKERLEAWQQQHPGFRLHILPFTDEMAELLQVASAVVARAGVTATSEALAGGCPIIFNALGGAMPQELPAIRYFRTRQIGTVISTASQIVPIIERWLNQPEDYAALKQRIVAARIPDETERMVREIIGAGS